MTRFFTIQRLSSWLFRKLTRIRTRWFKNLFIGQFAKLYRINWDDCKRKTPNEYRHFNDFFTRELHQDARTIDDSLLVSPSDGRIAAMGQLDGINFIEAKGHQFSLDALIADSEIAKKFQNGHFATIYLSPSNYHRIHMPIDGTLLKSIHIPGRLYSVSLKTADKIPTLFAQNERLVTLFETEIGEVLMILVGAINVSSIETVWDGVITPPYAKTLHYKEYQDRAITLKKGEEMGRFNMGSTIILLTNNPNLSFLSHWKLLDTIDLGNGLMEKSSIQDN